MTECHDKDKYYIYEHLTLHNVSVSKDQYYD